MDIVFRSKVVNSLSEEVSKIKNGVALGASAQGPGVLSLLTIYHANEVVDLVLT